MRIDVVTCFPGMIQAHVAEGMVRRAMDAGVADVRAVPLRDHADDKRRSVDDEPFGGGAGMVMTPGPFVRAREAVDPQGKARVLLLSASGERLTQEVLSELATSEHLVLLCGRYEGVDDRVVPLTGAREVSLGDFVLAGGEVAAMALVEGVVRLLPGAIGAPASLSEESFTWGGGLLEYPQYTRPSEFRGLRVPSVLLSGDHERVARWRRWMALRKTARVRPDLFARLALGEEDRRLLAGGEFEEEGTDGSAASR